MNRIDNFTGGTTSHSIRLPNDYNQVAGYKPLKWLMALLLAAVVAGCGNGDPILGGGGKGVVPNVAGDITKPRVTVTVPANAASGVPANTKITATFSEAMNSTTITAPGTFTLAQSGVPVAVGPVTYTVGSNTADIKPSANLTPGLVYTAKITTAAKDLAGNPLAGISATPLVANNHVWTFTAAAVDVTPPTIISTSPASGVTGVATNATVNATFSEAMDPSTISSTTFTVVPQSGVQAIGTYSYDLQTNIATFTPSSLLQTGTLYTATITNSASDLAGNALIAGATPNPWTFTTGNGLALGAVDLGSAKTFGLMATAAVTAASASIINGDVSLEPGTSITGFPPAIVNGAVHVNDTVSHQARNDLLAAYNYAKGLACATNVGTADLGGLYVYPTGIPPGVYCSGSSMLVGAHLVLDAGGNANAVWVFQIGSSATVNADVTLTGGAQAKNVFWVPTADMIIGSGVTFNGTIVTGRDANSAGSDTINGRILAGAITAGTIALNGPPTTVNVPAP
jgi:hypothetical protein